jgi:hypothetical protein
MRYVILLLVLAACTAQQADALLYKIRQRNSSSDDIKQAINSQCAEIGAPKGSPNYYNCYTHYENMVIQAMLVNASGGTSLPPVTAFSNPPIVPAGPFNPKLTCEQTYDNKTICY